MLHAFTGGADGAYSYGGFNPRSRSNLYGTTFGGDHNQGFGNVCREPALLRTPGKARGRHRLRITRLMLKFGVESSAKCW